MKKLLFVSFLFICNVAFLQNYPEIAVKPLKEKGKQKIYYRLKPAIEYIQNTKIIDWSNSLEKLTASEKYDPKKKYFIEECKFSEGKKNGEFTISTLQLKGTQINGNTLYYTAQGEEAISGVYLNNEYNGIIKSVTVVDLKEKEGFVGIEYLNGKIKDQTMKYPEQIKDKLGFLFYPTIVFKDGRASEILSLDVESNLPYYKKYSGNICSVIIYTNRPFCFNNFSFLTDEYINKNKSDRLINLNINKTSIETYDSRWDEKTHKYIINGNYRLFHLGTEFFDTATLVATYYFSNGKRNGQAKIWDDTKNGKNGALPYIKLNYKNDLLDGKSEYFYSDGKLVFSGSFLKGFPSGEFISYYNYPNYLLWEFPSVVPQWIPNAGLLMPYQISKFLENDAPATIREKGGSILDLTGYNVYCKINYKIDSIQTNGQWFKGSSAKDDYSTYNNGKPMVTYLIDKEKIGQFKNILFQDQSGKVVWSTNEGKKEVGATLIKKAKEIEQKDNSIVSCDWCKKQFKYGVRIELDECKCFTRSEDRPAGVMMRTKLFCSQDCRIQFEKDCCKSAGYKYE
jgi:antitoxin component YwqK of YwqJK toxin-antitoxin module